MLENDSLEMGHAQALLTLAEAQQIKIANTIVQKNLSVSETEQLVKRLLTPSRPRNNTYMDPDVGHLENSLAEKLAARVLIRYRQNDSGKLEIYYHSLDNLDGISTRI